MLLCLSSGDVPRYKQDILRALAMPAGARLQFRYKLKWVAERLWEKAKADGLGDAEACVAYVDQDKATATPYIVPIRAAKVQSTRVEGEFCIVEFVLAGFAFVQDLDAFNKQLRTLSGNLPHRTGDSLSGHYCENIDSTSLGINRQATSSEWQETCRRLSARATFRSQPFFYRFDGLRAVASEKSPSIENAAFRLRSGDLYDLVLLHYSPKSLSFTEPLTNDALNWLVADADEKSITFLTTKALAVDSDYDIKTVRIRAATTTVSLDARLSLSRRSPGAKPDDSTWDFDVQTRVTPRWLTLFWQGLAIGLPVGAQGWLVASHTPSLQDPLLVYAGTAVAGLGAGLAASFFGGKKG